MRATFFALIAFAPATAFAQDRDWTVSLSGGISSIEAQDDQTVASVSVSRAFGDAFVRGTLTRIEGGDFGGLTGALPATTTQFTLAGGASFGSVSIDAYALAGGREFDSERLRRAAGPAITLDTSGSVYGAGASATYDADLGGGWFASPFVSVDYNRVDTLRVLGAGAPVPVARETKEDGVTGSGGATLTYGIGGNARSSIGGYAAFVTTSNAAAVNRGGAAGSRLLSLFDSGGGDDSWGEFGAIAAIGLSDTVTLDASVVRTAGLAAGESTSGSLGLRFRF